MLKLEEGLKEGAKVEAGGWVASVRIQGDVEFIIIFESGKELQITVKGKGSRLWKQVEALKEHSSIIVEGRIHLTKKALGVLKSILGRWRSLALRRGFRHLACTVGTYQA